MSQDGLQLEFAAGRLADTGMSDAEWQARQDLAACYRLVALNGWDDLIYTHVSLAVPGEPGRFLINPFGLAFDEVTASNLVKIDIAGNIVGDSPHRVNKTGFVIHAAVHSARHDAQCVMHLHNDAGIAVAMLAEGLLPLSQHALRFYGDMAYHEYEGLALTEAEKTRLIASLGAKNAMLLRNHGTLVCGRTVAEAYCLMDTMDKACRIQLAAMAAGNLVMPPVEVCERTYQQLLPGDTPEGELEWPALLRKLERQSPGFRD